MSEKYKIIFHDKPNFITLTVVGWVDLFIRPVYTQILDESFRYCIKSKGLLIHAYVYDKSFAFDCFFPKRGHKYNHSGL
ncbi:hypothetical protein N9V60_00145 [Flavobacteriaceae bacterium]|nr:hypothetical protein [Flavobacteriaceae bacterium]